MKTALACVALVALVAGCGPSETEAAQAARAKQGVLNARDARLKTALARDDSGVALKPEVARWLLPDNLYEISGIALTADERLLAHEDQSATVYEIDYRRGVVTKVFTLGTQVVKGDFEGITVAKDKVFLFASTGLLYEFAEGANQARVAYTTHDTKLGSECEFEGVTFDPAMNALVLACKRLKEKAAGDSVVLYRWALDKITSERPSRMAVAIENVTGGPDLKALHPSDITVNPMNGNYVIVASHEKAIAEITPDGKMLYAKPLPGEHQQPEGIAITKDGILMISDESGHSVPQAGHRPAAVLALYKWK